MTPTNPYQPKEKTVRFDGRQANELREVKITRGWLDHAEGSVLVEFGRTVMTARTWSCSLLS